MRNQRHTDDALPLSLRQCVDVLKATDAQPLPDEVEARLYAARQAALRRFAEQKNHHQWSAEVLSWASFGHPRLLGAVAFSFFLAVGVLLMTANHTDDAMLLGDDFPLEAFADNGFEAWHASEHI